MSKIRFASEEYVNAKASDWDASADQSGYIKNRTHWVEPEVKIFTGPFQTSGTVTETGTWNSVKEHLQLGESYVVICGGVKYDVPCYQYTDGWSSTYYCLGDSRLNPSYPATDENGNVLYDENSLPICITDERYPSDAPFFIEYRLEDDGGSGWTWYHYYYAISESEVSVGTYTGNNTYHTLDKNFLPIDDIFEEIMLRLPVAEEVSF